MSIDISDLDKVKLLQMLWENSSPAIFFNAFPIKPPSFDRENASTAVESFIDYYCGRCIKMNLSGDSVDPYSYDRNYGTGTVARIVETLRNSS